MMKHYSKEELELFRNGGMSVLGRIACAAHLKECVLCAKRLELLKEDDQLIHELRESLRLFQTLSKASPASKSASKTQS